MLHLSGAQQCLHTPVLSMKIDNNYWPGCSAQGTLIFWYAGMLWSSPLSSCPDSYLAISRIRYWGHGTGIIGVFTTDIIELQADALIYRSVCWTNPRIISNLVLVRLRPLSGLFLAENKWDKVVSYEQPDDNPEQFYTDYNVFCVSLEKEKEQDYSFIFICILPTFTVCLVPLAVKVRSRSGESFAFLAAKFLRR